jgi:hypothetical protein
MSQARPLTLATKIAANWMIYAAAILQVRE